MKTTVANIVETIHRIEQTRSALSEFENNIAEEARDLLFDYRESLLAIKVEV